jgi:hypothetical protein
VTGILRLLVALGLFALLVDGQWARLVAALVGFLAVRVVLTRSVGLMEGHPGRAVAPARRSGGGLG